MYTCTSSRCEHNVHEILPIPTRHLRWWDSSRDQRQDRNAAIYSIEAFEILSKDLGFGRECHRYYDISQNHRHCHFGGLPENFGCVALVEEKWTFGAWIPCLSDSFSTSVELAKVLLRLGTFLNGTVKYNKRISSTIRKPIYCQGTQYSCAKDVLCFLRPTRKWEETSCALFCGVLAVISVYNKNKGGVDGADKQFFFHRLKEVTEGMEKDALHIVQQMLLNFWESDESFAVPSGGYLWVTFELS